MRLALGNSIVMIALLSLIASSSLAENPNGHQPTLCSGHYLIKTAWTKDATLVKDDGSTRCPPHAVLFGSVRAGGKHSDGKNIVVGGPCCPLPAEDILTNETTNVYEHCPDNFIAVGGQSFAQTATTPRLMFCQKINTARYQLGPAKPGHGWGALTANYGELKVYRRSELPPALRYGITRYNSALDSQGCIGNPIGSLLTGKTGKACKLLYYRELQFRGAPGDPPKGTPVQMFPLCRMVLHPYLPNAQCIPEEVAATR